jgi:hypothetical protein
VKLVENKGVRQRPDEGFRRWFASPFFELIVWYEGEPREISGFQLCVSRNVAERAFTWTKNYTSSHFVSETKVEPGLSGMATGILKGDGRRYSDEIVARFEAEAIDLEPELRSLVVEKLKDYNARG